MESNERSVFYDPTNRIEARRSYKPEEFTPTQLRIIQRILDGKTFKDIAEDLNTGFSNIRGYLDKIAQMMGELPRGDARKSAQRRAEAGKRIHRGFVKGVERAVIDGWVNTDHLPSKLNCSLEPAEEIVWRRFMEGCMPENLAEDSDLQGEDVPRVLNGFYAKLGIVNEFQAVAIGVKIVKQSQSTKGTAVSGS